MRSWFICICSVLLLNISAASESRVTISAEDATEFRYWTQINRIRDREATLRERQANTPQSSVRLIPKRYDHEGYAHLRPAFLLYAAREGAQHARKSLEGYPESEVERQVRENVAVALQYYPLVATESSHFQSLIDTMRDRQSDRILRLYLAEQLTASIGAHSLLGLYMNEELHISSEDSIRLLRRLSVDSLEDARIQQAALHGLYNFIYQSIERQMLRDEELQAYLIENEIATRPIVLLTHPEAPRHDSTRKLLADSQAYLEQLVEVYTSHLRPEANRPKETRQISLNYLQRIYDDMHYIKKEPLVAIISQHATTDDDGN